MGQNCLKNSNGALFTWDAVRKVEESVAVVVSNPKDLYILSRLIVVVVVISSCHSHNFKWDFNILLVLLEEKAYFKVQLHFSSHMYSLLHWTFPTPPSCGLFARNWADYVENYMVQTEPKDCSSYVNSVVVKFICTYSACQHTIFLLSTSSSM